MLLFFFGPLFRGVKSTTLKLLFVRLFFTEQCFLWNFSKVLVKKVLYYWMVRLKAVLKYFTKPGFKIIKTIT